MLNSGINIFTMRHLDEMGMATVARNALDRLRHMTRILFRAGYGQPGPGRKPPVWKTQFRVA